MDERLSLIDLGGGDFSNEEVQIEVASIEALLTLLPDSPAIYPAWKAVVTEYRVQGVKVHDARLVAVMNVSKIDTILTFNDADFRRYSGMMALNPSMIEL